ncbi:hypothetical protein SLA2020_087750 [Shorea laevis]
MNRTKMMCTSNSNGDCYCGVVGFRFSPSDEEIICHYLWHKISGDDNLTLAISEVQLLQCEPWDLPSRSVIKSNDHVWYFFCRRDTKYANSQRANRKTKEGFWKVTGTDRTIRARGTNESIGTKKTLVYHKGSASNAVGTNWVIHEYRPTAYTIPSNPRDFVVCRLEEKPDEKNSPSRKGECGSSPPSTSNNRAANNALPERDPHLEANTGPFVGNNAMDYELAVQASMEEQGLLEERGLFVEEVSDFHDIDQEWMQEQDPSYMDMLPNGFSIGLNVGRPESVTDDENGEEFVNSLFVDDDEFIEETVNTLQHGYRPSRPCTRVYMNDSSETETVMGNVQNRPYSSEGFWQNPMENEFNYEDILIFDTASNDSAAGTSYRRNSHESAQKDTSITTRTFKSQYQPRSTPLTEKAPRNIQLQSGFSSKNAVPRDKSNKGREMDQEKKTKEDSSRRSPESTGSNRRGSSIFKETTQSTSTPSPRSVYLVKFHILKEPGFAIFSGKYVLHETNDTKVYGPVSIDIDAFYDDLYVFGDTDLSIKMGIGIKVIISSFLENKSIKCVMC